MDSLLGKSGRKFGNYFFLCVLDYLEGEKSKIVRLYRTIRLSVKSIFMGNLLEWI